MLKKFMPRLLPRSFFLVVPGLITFLALANLGTAQVAVSPERVYAAQDSAVPIFECTRVSTGWIDIVNKNPYSTSCPEGYQGVYCGFDFYDTNTSPGPGAIQYHGFTPGYWSDNRTKCNMTTNDTGIKQGQLLAECCRVRMQ